MSRGYNTIPAKGTRTNFDSNERLMKPIRTDQARYELGECRGIADG